MIYILNERRVDNSGDTGLICAGLIIARIGLSSSVVMHCPRRRWNHEQREWVL